MILSWDGWFNTLGTTLSGVGDIIKGMSGTADELIGAYKTLIDIQRVMKATNLNASNDRTGGVLTQATVAGAGSLDALSKGSQDFLSK
jgi:hypothetical protein